MNKIKYCLLAALPLASCAFTSVNAEGGASLNAEQAQTMADFFASPLRSTATITPTYKLLTVPSLTAVEEVSGSARHSRLLTQGEVLLANDFVSDASGNALLQSINISNEVESSALLDDDSNPIPFADYGSGYAPLAGLSADDISTYFEVSETETGYTLYGNQKATALLTPSLTAFQYNINPYSFDTVSATQYVDKIVLELSADGTPVSMSYRSVNADRFGAMGEYYEVEFEAIDEVSALSPLESSMGEEDKQTLQSALDGLAASLLGGNFTAHISLDAYSNGVPVGEEPAMEYNAYYDYFGPREVMLTDLALEDSTYGKTYTGMAHFEFDTGVSEGETEHVDGYAMIGVSPESNYASNITEDIVSLEEAVPNVGLLDAELFEKDEEGYYFDLAGFLYNDYYFCLDVMESILGAGDYLSRVASYYLGSTTSFTFDFDSLRVELVEGGLPVFRLSFFSDMIGYDIVTTVSFSNVGTTDLDSVPELASVLSTFDLYFQTSATEDNQ